MAGTKSFVVWPEGGWGIFSSELFDQNLNIVLVLRPIYLNCGVQRGMIIVKKLLYLL